MSSSRIPAFYQLSVEERRRKLAEALGLGAADVDDARRPPTRCRSRSPTSWSRTPSARSRCPSASALNFQVNGRDYVVPDGGRGAVGDRGGLERGAGGARGRRLRRRGRPGRDDRPDPARATCPIPARAVERIGAARARLLAAADGADARALPARRRPARRRGAARAHAARRDDGRRARPRRHRRRDGRQRRQLAGRGRWRRWWRRSRAARRACASSRTSPTAAWRAPPCACPCAALGRDGLAGEEVAERMLYAYEFADADPYRAATHNKGIMNGIDAVAVATGNDWRGDRGGRARLRLPRRRVPLAHHVEHRGRAPGRHASSCRWRSRPSGRWCSRTRACGSRSACSACRGARELGGHHGGRRPGVEHGGDARARDRGHPEGAHGAARARRARTPPGARGDEAEELRRRLDRRRRGEDRPRARAAPRRWRPTIVKLPARGPRRGQGHPPRRARGRLRPAGARRRARRSGSRSRWSRGSRAAPRRERRRRCADDPRPRDARARGGRGASGSTRAASSSRVRSELPPGAGSAARRRSRSPCCARSRRPPAGALGARRGARARPPARGGLPRHAVGHRPGGGGARRAASASCAASRRS